MKLVLLNSDLSHNRIALSGNDDLGLTFLEILYVLNKSTPSVFLISQLLIYFGDIKPVQHSKSILVLYYIFYSHLR